MDDLVPYPAEPGPDFIIRPIECRGVRETLMNFFLSARKERTCFLCGITDGNNRLNSPPEELIDKFRPVPGDINSDLYHHLDRHRMDLAFFGSTTENFIAVTVLCIHVPFRHLGAGGVVGADEQDLLFHENTSLFSP